LTNIAKEVIFYREMAANMITLASVGIFCHFPEAGICNCIGIDSHAIVNQQARAGLPQNTV
jgi:hypothetical protein